METTASETIEREAAAGAVGTLEPPTNETSARPEAPAAGAWSAAIGGGGLEAPHGPSADAGCAPGGTIAVIERAELEEASDVLFDEQLEREQAETEAAAFFDERPPCAEAAETEALRTEDEGESGSDAPPPVAGNPYHNIELGKRGEDAACAFLMRHGFDILERNWTCAAGEADIIATDPEALHFIEVKTRMSEARGFPAEAVDAKKRKRYERIAELFLRSYEERFDTRVTFDVISILVTGPDRAFLRLHRNVFADECA